MERPTFSIIGCQHWHLSVFIRDMLDMGHPCAGIYEDASEDRKLAEALSDKFGIPLLERMDEALASDVGFVGCASVNNRKIDVVEICEKQGKHIMLDKPAVTSRDGLERLRGVVGRGKIEIGMLLTERFHPAVYTLKQQIEEGALGRLVSIGMRKPHRLSAAGRPRWFFDRDRSGAIIQDLLIHDFDLLRWLTGSEIAESQGFMLKTILPEHPGFFDAAQLLVRMDSGLIAQLYADWHTPDKSWTWGDCRIFVVGTEGSAELRLQGDPLLSQTPAMLMTTVAKELHMVPLRHPPTGITRDFLDRTQGKASTVTSADVLFSSSAAVDADERAELRFAGPVSPHCAGRDGENG